MAPVLRRIPTRPWISFLLVAGLAVGLVCVAIGPASAQASASAGWLQFQGGATHPGSVDAGPSPAYAKAWEVSVPPGGPRGAYGLSPPIVAGGTAVAVGPTSVVGIDVATGAKAWTIDKEIGPSVPAAVGGSGKDALVLYTEGWGAGPPDASATPSATPASTTPTAAASASAAPGATTPGSTLVAVSLADRSPAWTLPLPAVSRTGVTVDGDLAFVGTNDGTVAAVDLATGQTRWTGSAGGALVTPLAVGDGLVVAGVVGSRSTGASVVALKETDGTRAWSYAAPRTAVVAGSPSLGAGTAYVAFSDNTVRAIALADGSERWSARMNGFVLGSPPAVAGDAVIAADVRGEVYRFDAATGARVWDFALNQSVFRTAPVVIGSSVLVTTTDGDLVAFDLQAGTLVSRTSAGAAPLRSLAVAGDTVVAVRAGSAGGMVGFRNDPGVALTAVESPTVLHLPLMLGTWALVTGVFVVLLLVLGRFLWARLGPPALDGERDAAVDEEDL
ncbi:MAG: PQQ-binding-like beta-propeller repeat protein [Planctomycetaceae bacterium]